MSNPAIFWAILGLALIVVEVFTATFILIFFGVSALVVAGLTLMGLSQPVWQIILFAVIAVAGAALLRSKLVSTFSAKRGLPIDEAQVIELSADVPAGSTAQILYQGTTWVAVNETAEDFKRGEKAMIARMDGVKIVLARP